MSYDLSDEANIMVDRLTKGDLKAIASLYQFPAVVYWGDEALVLKDEAQLVHALGIYRSILMRNGLTLATAQVVDMPLAEADRFTMIVANGYFRADGSSLGTSRIKYFVQREGACLRIRLVEYLDWPCKDEIERDGRMKEISRGQLSVQWKAPTAQRPQADLH